MERQFERLQEIIDKHEGNVTHLIGILQDVQDEYRYLPEEVLTYIATALDISPVTVYGVATFYTQFSLLPKGKYIIKVCDGTACHVRGSEPIYLAIREFLGLKPGQNTTDDLQFTVETVSCLGACGIAPVMIINNEEVHGQSTKESALDVVKELQHRLEKDHDTAEERCSQDA